ncbi:MAG TPA: hypothetical protein VJR47_17830 [Stellaceae bacterium]|nr:hypothetical protein [Stellaceae bacterium]
MAQYRCYFLGADDQLMGAETIQCEGDAEAMSLARRTFALKAYAKGFELLEGERRVAAVEVSHP